MASAERTTGRTRCERYAVIVMVVMRTLCYRICCCYVECSLRPLFVSLCYFICSSFAIWLCVIDLKVGGGGGSVPKSMLFLMFCPLFQCFGN